MNTYIVKNAAGTPMLKIRAESGGAPPVSIEAEGPEHQGLVEFLEDLRQMHTVVTTSMLLSRCGPYTQVECIEEPVQD